MGRGAAERLARARPPVASLREGAADRRTAGGLPTRNTHPASLARWTPPGGGCPEAPPMRRSPVPVAGDGSSEVTAPIRVALRPPTEDELRTRIRDHARRQAGAGRRDPHRAVKARVAHDLQAFDGARLPSDLRQRRHALPSRPDEGARAQPDLVSDIRLRRHRSPLHGRDEHERRHEGAREHRRAAHDALRSA